MYPTPEDAITAFDILMIFSLGIVAGWLSRMSYVIFKDAYESGDVPDSPTKSAGLSGVIKK